MKRLLWVFAVSLSACASTSTPLDAESKTKKQAEPVYRPSRFDFRY